MTASVGKFCPWPSLAKLAALLFASTLLVASSFGQDVATNPTVTPQSPNSQPRPSWQIGAFAMGGFPPSYEIEGSVHYRQELNFYSAGIEAGKMLTAQHGPGPLHGYGEAVFELIPFWLAHAPKQEDLVSFPRFNEQGFAGFGEYSVHGVSITPLLFRWNFMKKESPRFVPWAQLGSGLLWTSQRFPQGTDSPGGKTSRINFTPQISLGTNVFTRNKQSIDLSVRAIHISSAGLGEYNPGVPLTVQFSLGYSWWK